MGTDVRIECEGYFYKCTGENNSVFRFLKAIEFKIKNSLRDVQ